MAINIMMSSDASSAFHLLATCRHVDDFIMPRTIMLNIGSGRASITACRMLLLMHLVNIIDNVHGRS